MQALQNLAVSTRLAIRRHATRSAGDAPFAAYIGGHGGGNLGDDLMTRVAQSLFPGRRLVDFAESWHEQRLARLGLSGPVYFSQVLLGGGTLISPFWYGKVEAAVDLGLRVSSLGTGVGSCGFIQPDHIDLSHWAPLLRRFHRLGVRGPRSVQRLREMGVDHAEAVGDLALWLTREEPAPAADPPVVAVNLSLPAAGDPAYDEPRRFAELAAALCRLRLRGWEIRPYAMNPVDVAPTLQAMLDAGCGEVGVPHLTSVEAFFDHVGPATVNVAVRLHGGILGCCVGVPPLMLAYREKGLDFMESMGLERWCIDLPRATHGEIASRLAELIAAAPGLRATVLQRARAWRSRLTRYAGELLDAA